MFKSIFSLLILSIFFTACNDKNILEENILEKTFEKIQQDAKSTKVSIYMWGGSKEVNDYFDLFVIPNVKKKFDITLHRVPIDDVKTVLQKIELEKNSNRKGNIDIVWLNGENFKIAKTKELLYGSFVSKLPNYRNFVDTKNSSNLLDFSEDTNGLEAPFGKSQFVMVYNSAKVKNPPKNNEELFTWVKNNPNRFTYPASPDFTGSAFIRQLFLNKIGGMKNFDESNYKNSLNELFEELNSLKQYMFKQGTYFPNSTALLDTLYANGSIDFTFSYNPSHALNKIKTSNFPATSKTALFEIGTLSNTHFLTIPKTASNVQGAITVINFLLSSDAQYEKAKNSVWGDGTVLDIHKLPVKIKQDFLNLSLHESLVDTTTLQNNQIPELDAITIEKIEKSWIKNVLKK